MGRPDGYSSSFARRSTAWSNSPWPQMNWGNS
jgi:hypothetical protein